ncbi:MAG: hypothetical protein AAFQ94_27905 [Bacteroidota bacterium]
MVRKLIILSLTLICLTGFAGALQAQEGDPEEFGKKVQSTESDNEEANRQEPENANTDAEESGSLKPIKNTKAVVNGSDNPISTLSKKSANKEDSTQTAAPKAKKYNILLYYFYKSKYEETETKDKE